VRYWQTVDRLYNTPVDTVTQKKQTVDCEVLTDTEQTVLDSSGRSDKESTDGALWGTGRQWTDSTSNHWTQWYRTNGRWSMRYWQTVGRLYKTPVDAVTQKQLMVQCVLLTYSGQTVQDTSGCSDTEPTDGTVGGTERQWADYIRHQWTQWHRTN